MTVIVVSLYILYVAGYEVSTAGSISSSNSESEMSYMHGSDSQSCRANIVTALWIK